MLGRQHRKFYLNRFLLLGTVDVCLIVVCNSVLVKQPFQIPDFRLQATYATFIINSIHDVSLHLVTPLRKLKPKYILVLFLEGIAAFHVVAHLLEVFPPQVIAE